MTQPVRPLGQCQCKPADVVAADAATAAAAAVRSRRSTAVVQISRQRVREEAEHHERQQL
jgi:hypothetical protein